LRKHFFKEPCSGMESGFEIYWRAALALETCHFHAGEAAGGDAGKAGGGAGEDVDGEAVHGNPFANADAQGGELSLTDPHAGEALAALGRDTKAGGEADEIFLEEAEIEVEVASTLGEIKDGITYELARAVVGSLPAAIGLEDRVPEGFAQAGAVACAADGVDGLVLEEDECVVALIALHLPDNVFLKGESGFEGESTRKENIHRRRSADGAGNLVV